MPAVRLQGVRLEATEDGVRIVGAAVVEIAGTEQVVPFPPVTIDYDDANRTIGKALRDTAAEGRRFWRRFVGLFRRGKDRDG